MAAAASRPATWAWPGSWTLSPSWAPGRWSRSMTGPATPALPTRTGWPGGRVRVLGLPPAGMMPGRSAGPWRRRPGGLRIQVTAGCLAARRKLVREPVEQGNQAWMLIGMPVTDVLRDALMPGAEQGVERVLPRIAEWHRLVQVRP